MKKRAQKVPAHYAGLDASKEGTTLCLVIDEHGDVFKFDDGSSVTIITEAIAHKFVGFDMFDTYMERHHDEFARLHERVFHRPCTRDDDLIMGRLFLWKKLVQIAKDRTAKKELKNEQGRKYTIGTRCYFAGPRSNDKEQVSLIKTPQAKACFRILMETLASRKEQYEKFRVDPTEVIVPSVTELELRKIIESRAAELNTKQDPWRIFQYYRPTLLQDHLITHD
jgi:hypothetical protein